MNRHTDPETRMPVANFSNGERTRVEKFANELIDDYAVSNRRNKKGEVARRVFDDLHALLKMEVELPADTSPEYKDKKKDPLKGK
jgi:hypothetical protein